MKNLWFLLLAWLFLTVICLDANGQATPIQDLRVPTRIAVFGKTLPVGSTIICLSDSTHWDVTAPTAADKTITTAIAGNLIKQSDRTDLSLAARTSTTNTIRSNYGTADIPSGRAGDSVVLNVATTSLAGLESAADKTKLDGLSVGAGQSYSNTIEIPIGADSTAGSILTMDFAPKDTTCITLSWNGEELKRSVDYFCTNAIAKKELLIKNPMYQCDKFHYIISK
jgi:hypothetical protein